MVKSTYIPGVCNIGPAQIRVRWIFGWTGALLTVCTWLLFRRLGASALWYWGLAAPATVAAIGFLQAYNHFCADFGLRGVFNMDPELTATDTPIQAQYRNQDRQKALSILFTSIGLGLFVAIVAVWLAK